MKTILFLLLAGYAVRCNGDYFVIEMPPTSKKDFKVYWNVPTMQCKSKQVYFNNLFQKYGIIQNINDTHRGNEIVILYDPGNFPALFVNESSGEVKSRNGGVPQQGDLVNHLQTFKHEMEQSIPDEHFHGIGIIDFESWRPILRQNFGVLTPYKDVSYEIEKKKHFWWKKEWIQEEARKRFEAAGRHFMHTTLELAKKIRPKAKWGYYGYPHCFNRAINRDPQKCAKEMADENDQINWLWAESTAIFPSVYSTAGISPTVLSGFIKGRIKESARVNKRGAPILPYWWFRYRDDGFFTEDDLEAAFSAFYESSANGFIVWGSSRDVNTKDKCNKLKTYLTKTLGPAIAKYTKRNYRRTIDESNDIDKYAQDKGELEPLVYPEEVKKGEEKLNDIKTHDQNNSKVSKHIEKTTGSNVIDIIMNRIVYNHSNSAEIDSNDTSTETAVTLTTKDPFLTTLNNATVSAEVVTKPTVVVTNTTEVVTETTEVVTRTTSAYKTTELNSPTEPTEGLFSSTIITTIRPTELTETSIINKRNSVTPTTTSLYYDTELDINDTETTTANIDTTKKARTYVHSMYYDDDEDTYTPHTQEDTTKIKVKISDTLTTNKSMEKIYGDEARDREQRDQTLITNNHLNYTTALPYFNKMFNYTKQKGIYKSNFDTTQTTSRYEYGTISSKFSTNGQGGGYDYFELANNHHDNPNEDYDFDSDLTLKDAKIVVDRFSRLATTESDDYISDYKEINNKNNSLKVDEDTPTNLNTDYSTTENIFNKKLSFDYDYSKQSKSESSKKQINRGEQLDLKYWQIYAKSLNENDFNETDVKKETEWREQVYEPKY